MATADGDVDKKVDHFDALGCFRTLKRTIKSMKRHTLGGMCVCATRRVDHGGIGVK